MTEKKENDLEKKKQISDFKKRADGFNKDLYSDIKSFRIGFVIILTAASVILLYLYFSNR